MFDDLGIRIHGSLDECADNPGVRAPRWWFGGVSSSTVATVMAPLDIVKTHMQTQNQRRDMMETARRIFERRGLLIN